MSTIRFAVIIVASLALAGCSSFSVGDWMPSMSGGGGAIPLRLDSEPPGAEARTSAGPACRTPCVVSVPMSDNLTVTFALAGFETQTVPATLVRSGSDPEFFSGPQFAPVLATLEPAAPTPVAKRKGKPKPRSANRPAGEPAAERPAAQRPKAAPTSSPPASTGTTRAPAAEPPASQRSIPGSAPTAPPAPPGLRHGSEGA